MVSWKKQGAALVGTLALVDGREANVVLVGARQNPKGAVLIVPSRTDGHLQTVLLSDSLDQLDQSSVVEVLCMQELAFGKGRLKAVVDPGQS